MYSYPYDEGAAPSETQFQARKDSALSAATAALLPDEFEIDNEHDGGKQEQDDGTRDELIGGDAAAHGGQHLARARDVVIGAVQRVARVADRLPLPVQVLQNAHAQLLHPFTSSSCSHMHDNTDHLCQVRFDT